MSGNTEVKVYCVYDTLANFIVMTLEQPNSDCAIRALTTMVNNSENNVDGFVLYEIATLNRETPSLVGYDAPVLVTKLSDLIED